MTTPNQQYVYVQNPSGSGPSRTRGPMSGSNTGSQGQQQGTGSGGASRTGGGQQNASGSRQQVPIPKGLPPMLGNRKVLFYSWIASMILVGFDEWHNYRILPRPSRLWSTSLVYGLLTLGSVVDAVVPLANAFGVGYTIMLLWQYYNGSGQFSKSSGKAS